VELLFDSPNWARNPGAKALCCVLLSGVMLETFTTHRIRCDVMKTKNILLILLVAVIAAVAVKMAKSARESEWEGLTESEARGKLDAKLPDRIPEQKRAQISDKLVAKMGDKGILVADDEASDERSGQDAPTNPR
jgi:hypothetical protein